MEVIGAYFPKGNCMGWDPVQIWGQVAADALIAIGYCVLPLVLLRTARARKSIYADPIMMRVYIAWAAVILFGFFERLVMIALNWVPIYGVHMGLKWGAAIVVFGGAVIIAVSLSKGLALREHVMSAVIQRRDELAGELEERNEALATATESTQQGIFELEALLQQGDEGVASVEQIMSGMRKVIAELRAHVRRVG